MEWSTSPQTDNHASTLPHSFYRHLSCRPTNSVKALKAENREVKVFTVSALETPVIGNCSLDEKYDRMHMLHLHEATQPKQDNSTAM